MAVFTKACVGEAEALRYSFGYLIAALYSGPLKGALAAFGCGLVINMNSLYREVPSV